MKLKPSQEKIWLRYYTPEDCEKTYQGNNIYQTVKLNAQKNLDRTALYYYGITYTYERFLNTVDKFANLMHHYGVKEGDFVYLAMPTTPEAIMLTYAINKLGAYTVMIDIRAGLEEFNDLDSVCKGQLFFAFDWTIKRFASLKKLGNIKTIVHLSPTESVFRNRFKVRGNKFEIEYLTLREFENKYAEGEEAKESNKESGIVFYTGGSTGVSKSVLHTDGEINEAVSQYSSFLSYCCGDRVLNCMPLFTCYGFNTTIHLPLAETLTIYIIPLMKAHKMPKVIQKYRLNHVFGVPSHFERFIKPGLKVNCSSLKNVIIAGDTLSRDKEVKIIENLRKNGYNGGIFKGYGMTETCSIGTMPRHLHNDPSSVGIPCPRVVVRIVDDEGNELDYGQEGNIEIGAKSVSREYFTNKGNDKAVPVTMVDGLPFIHSGDIGYMARDGQVYVSGRKKRMIVGFNGSKIFPSAVENILLKVDGIQDAVVVSIPDKNHEFGKVLVGFIKPKANYKQSKILKNIDEALKESKFAYFAPVAYHFIHEVPLNKSNKTDYAKLEKIAIEKGVKKSKYKMKY